jgi:hypothetical protein
LYSSGVNYGLWREEEEEKKRKQQSNKQKGQLALSCESCRPKREGTCLHKLARGPEDLSAAKNSTKIGIF